METKGWINRANKIIAEHALEQYKKLNPKPKKKHQPYSLAGWVEDLIKAIGDNDEVTAKSIMLHNYGARNPKDISQFN